MNSRNPPADLADGISTREVGHLPDGRPVHEITLAHGGLVLSALTLGGIVNALYAPDRAGRAGNVVRGFDTLEQYVAPHPSVGIIVGRVVNRIAGARFELDGRTYPLEANDGPNTLHGGSRSFGTQLWEIESARADDPALHGPAVTLRLVSEDGDQGFPGRLETRVTYSLRAGRTWQVDYEATTDRATPVNLSHHDYFNLAGSGSALEHRLTLPASRYNTVDTALIPTGTADVGGTPFDFRVATRVGVRVRDAHEQLVAGRGYDHHWTIDGGHDGSLRLAAVLEDPSSGRTMSLHTTAPGIQFYSGNFLDGTLHAHGGEVLERHFALCLEPQYAPDSVHHPEWPSIVLQPGQTWRSRSVYRFGVNALL